MNPTMLDTPIWQLTPRQLFELQEEWAKRIPQQQTQESVKEWMTVEQASEELGRSKATIYRYIKNGQLDAKVIGFIQFVNIKNSMKSKQTKQYKQTKRDFTNIKD